MSRKRRVFGGAFKAKVALAACPRRQDDGAVGRGVRGACQPGDGLEEAAVGAGGGAVRGRPAEAAGEESAANEQELYEQIGRLKMEVEWLKKKSAELG